MMRRRFPFHFIGEALGGLLAITSTNKRHPDVHDVGVGRARLHESVRSLEEFVGIIGREERTRTDAQFTSLTNQLRVGNGSC